MTIDSTSNHSHRTAEFIVASDVMRTFMGMVERVARNVATVLILGETGTGKETIAHTIHEQSTRRGKSFVEINCAALPENLVESELFGYEKGAFSGADTAKPGLFELAHNGTIFLDEIGELDPRIQVKLLRVLDRAPYFRLGGHHQIAVDVRIVAATNRDLKEEVRAGHFRKDLYHRLAQFEVCVPPLRDRPADILALARHFLAQASSDHTFSDDALRALQSYAWPGNVRELQNVVNKAWSAASGPTIDAEQVRAELANASGAQDEAGSHDQPPARSVGHEEQAIKQALEQTHGHRGKAARFLGISRRTLSRKLREFGFPLLRPSSTKMGALNNEQERSFRAYMRIPVSLESSEGDLTCIAVNLSISGMGLEDVNYAPTLHSLLRVHFLLPESVIRIDATGRVAWADAKGRVGISFTKFTPEGRVEVKHWLYQKIAEEGWTGKSRKIASTPVGAAMSCASGR